jgi:hypothetical protein
MEQLATYKAKGKEIGLIFLFKYDLNGNLRAFNIVEGELDDRQIKWLFSPNFPANETIMKTVWQKDEKYTKVFEVEFAPADISFEALWQLYDYKVSKLDAQKAFKKLKEQDIIKCFIEVPYYLASLAKSGVGKLHLSTYINKRRFEDERQYTAGKNQNPMLSSLAYKKTEK